VIQNIVRDWGDTTVQNAAVLVRAIDAAAEAVEHAAATLAYLVSLASGQTADLSFGNILADVNLMDNAMARFADNGLRRVEQAMSRVSQSIDQAAASIARMNNQLGSFTVPASLIGHSPPPLANWLNEVAVGAANAALGFGGMRRGLSQQQPLYQAPSTTVNRTNSVSLSVSVGQMGGNMTPERLGAFLNDYLVRALS